MYTQEDHETLKCILLYQSVLEYLKSREAVQKMTEEEKNEFFKIIDECFEVAKKYNGTIEYLNLGCQHILESKQYITLFHSTLK